MEKWEYLTVNTEKLTWQDEGFMSRSPELTKLGEEGWEICAYYGIYLFFKRRKTEKKVGEIKAAAAKEEMGIIK